jgi:hypothetical protein
MLSFIYGEHIIYYKYKLNYTEMKIEMGLRRTGWSNEEM